MDMADAIGRAANEVRRIAAADEQMPRVEAEARVAAGQEPLDLRAPMDDRADVGMYGERQPQIARDGTGLLDRVE
jgi:hypothetical protein